MDLEEYLDEITDTRWVALHYLYSINEQTTIDEVENRAAMG